MKKQKVILREYEIRKTQTEIKKLSYEYTLKYLLSHKRNGVCLWSIPQHGKTNALKQLVKQIIKNRDLVYIFDTAFNWSNYRPKINYLSVNNEDFMSKDIINLIDLSKSTIFDLSNLRVDYRSILCNYLVNELRRHQYLIKKDMIENLKNKRKIIYPLRKVYIVIEELQNVLGEYFFRSTEGKTFRAIHSEKSNFDMSFIYCTQRASEIPTGMIERDLVLFGKLRGHNDLRKVKGILSGIDKNTVKTQLSKIQSLKLGNFFDVETKRIFEFKLHK